jgi:protein associated with RNAse G/E
MDLDVVRALDERGIWIDDRDEWDEHRVHYGYPTHVVERLEALAVDLERRVTVAEAPFDDRTADAWLERLAALGLPPQDLGR